eukprot:Plantae.Rhodophyta-Hildenbrandia_rubra.ctg5636.p1 GENE.Plantae.Rhodophyta-Hildenbrandia_rubra.ctg5636~~Plantae.Rhodophyta-Hildenbrandia_rubra.ctg5636.p1  ORF type:complete len:196 (-),score=12.60 Plantae.Rhodophyta-Hildenbrandia_rubra.ctg5636:873-1460(-)
MTNFNPFMLFIAYLIFTINLGNGQDKITSAPRAESINEMCERGGSACAPSSFGPDVAATLTDPCLALFYYHYITNRGPDCASGNGNTGGACRTCASGRSFDFNCNIAVDPRCDNGNLQPIINEFLVKMDPGVLNTLIGMDDTGCRDTTSTSRWSVLTAREIFKTHCVPLTETVKISCICNVDSDGTSCGTCEKGL